jgi:antitoxin component YwqK of YwqJK toxin-antitoxin module
MDSVWIYYHPNGKVLSRGNFKDDERQGITTYYAVDGSELFQKNYENGDLIAYRGLNTKNEFEAWVKYTGDESISFSYPSGKKAFEEHHKKGALTGSRKYYFQNGNLSQEYTFDSGDFHGAFASYYENGKVRMKGQYKWDELDGVLEYYNEDGTLQKTINFVLGVRNGKTAIYDKGVKVKEFDYWDNITK